MEKLHILGDNYNVTDYYNLYVNFYINQNNNFYLLSNYNKLIVLSNSVYFIINSKDIRENSKGEDINANIKIYN